MTKADLDLNSQNKLEASFFCTIMGVLQLERRRKSWNNFHISGTLVLTSIFYSWSISFHSIHDWSESFDYGFHSVM